MNTFLVGSGVLSCTSLLSMYLISHKKAIGWLVVICAQLMWVPYDIITGQYPFIAIACASLPIYIRGYGNFKQHEKDSMQPVDNSADPE